MAPTAAPVMPDGRDKLARPISMTVPMIAAAMGELAR